MEIPSLTAINREMADRGVEIIGLSVEDPREAANEVKMFASQYGISYRLGFANDEMFTGISGADQAAVVPQTLVFDRHGRLVLHLRGLHPDFDAVLRERIEQAL